MKASIKPKYHSENIDYEYTNPFFKSVLIITGEKIVHHQKENFAKYFRIPENIDIDRIQARLNDDQLKIQLPRLQSKARQMIAIK